MVKVSMKGDLARQIRTMRARSGDFGPALAVYGDQKLKTLIDNNFRLQRDARDLPWKKLADSTLDWKEDHRYSSKALIRTSKLQREITVQHRGSSVVVAYSPATEYGQYHQWSDVNSETRMPLRRFLPFIGPSTAPRVMHQGRMAPWFDALLKAIKRYIETGKVR